MFGKKPKNHTIDYVILLATLTAAAISIQLLSLNKSSIVLVSVILSIGYVLWGVMHHKKAGHIDKKIVLEYAGIAILVNALIFFVATN